ncbi:hypothetical protein FKM82_027899 [Ascaphus truei]
MVVTGATQTDNSVQSPGSSMKLMLRADHNASVGLVAVDKAVYVLNKKFKISQSKVWDSVEKWDIGCTPGSGADSVGVFYDAGLTLQTNLQMTTVQRSEPVCPVLGKRKRRSSVVLIEYKATKATSYTGQEKKCCQDGMQENPMGHNCERRSRLILDGGECVAAFLDCCKYIEKLRADQKNLENEDILGRSEEP